MGCRFIEGYEAGTALRRVAMYDSVTCWAFGPTFPSVEYGEEFLEFLRPKDPRQLSNKALEIALNKFQQHRKRG